MATKAKKITKESILTMYMDYVLENEKVPKTVYKFCKINGLEESEFYVHFGSINAMQRGIWNSFFKP